MSWQLKLNRNILACARCQCLKLQSRNTHIVKHAKRIPSTIPGQFQRPPSDKQELQMYDFVQDSVVEYPPVKVILLKSVDGIGRRGDVVSVSSDDFHNTLLPTGSAIYATPYDLKILEQQTLEGQFSQLSPEDMISFEHKKLARVLNGTIIKITMTFDEEWTLEKKHLRINLRRVGFVVPEEHIVLPGEELGGPNKNLQGKFITFYIKHTPHCIVPVLGCIDQVSSKGHQIIAVQMDKDAMKAKEIEDMTQPIFYSLEPLVLTDDEIRALMKSKSKSAAKEIS